MKRLIFAAALAGGPVAAHAELDWVTTEYITSGCASVARQADPQFAAKFSHHTFFVHAADGAPAHARFTECLHAHGVMADRTVFER